MIGLLCFVLVVLASPFKSKLRLEAESAVLRHQLAILRRRLHGRIRLTADRMAASSDAVFAVIVTIMVLELKASDQSASIWTAMQTISANRN
jgi:hypothetical protein